MRFFYQEVRNYGWVFLYEEQNGQYVLHIQFWAYILLTLLFKVDYHVFIGQEEEVTCVKNFLWEFHGTNWYSDIPTINPLEHGFKQFWFLVVHFYGVGGAFQKVGGKHPIELSGAARQNTLMKLEMLHLWQDQNTSSFILRVTSLKEPVWNSCWRDVLSGFWSIWANSLVCMTFTWHAVIIMVSGYGYGVCFVLLCLCRGTEIEAIWRSCQWCHRTRSCTIGRYGTRNGEPNHGAFEYHNLRFLGIEEILPCLEDDIDLFWFPPS